MDRKKLKSILKKVIVYGLIALVVWALFIKPKNLTSQVKKVELEKKVITKNISAGGVVESINSADLSFSATGRVTAIKVKKGDTVTKGQYLAAVDTRSSFQTAQSLKDARDYYQRELDYYIERKPDNMDTYKGSTGYDLKLRGLQEKVSQAEASYQAQLALMGNSYIYSPFEGTITEVNKELSENATLGEVVIKLADLNNLKFVIEVDQEDYGLIKAGMPVEIKLNAYDDLHTFKGTVTNLPFFADPTTKNFEIEMSIASEPGFQVLLGMEGDAYIQLATTGTEVSALSADDIAYDLEDKPFVWVVRDGKLAKLPIELGLEGDIFTEVKTQITETIVVPAKDSDKLTEGYTAKIINPK